MDRNSVIGILLIAAIMFGWLYMMQPSPEELEKQRRQQDSLIRVAQEQEKKFQKSLEKDSSVISAVPDSLSQTDSAKKTQLVRKYGVFADAVSGKDDTLIIENELIRAWISTKGGRICAVQLKNYKRHDSTPLILFDPDSSSFGLSLETDINEFTTSDFYFVPQGGSFTVKGEQSNKLVMRLNAGPGRYLEYEYSLQGNNYMVGCKINLVNMQDVISRNVGNMILHWAMKTPSQEMNKNNQRMASTVYFKYVEEDPDYISEGSNETKTLDTKTKWVAFKQQFFSSIIIADDQFDKVGADITSINHTDSSDYIKTFAANLSIPVAHKEKDSFGMRLYFGPDHYQTLRQYDLDLERIIPLGWSIFRYINIGIVIPIFNWLDNMGMNYGLIILVLTIIFKIIMFPLAYKTFISSAKMRILKPDIEEINKKYEGKDPLEKQQATMALYKRAGVSPFAGCLPLLLQMPILFALLRFFPASIELRQQPFLWAHDLSTYDSIWEFGYIPVINFIYGDHVSLFALLMTASTLLITWSNSHMMNTGTQLPGMKFMMYFMPFMFLSFLNNYSSGLSYYYFLANMITYGQTIFMQRFVDEDKLRARIEANKKKPVKKSSFQERLEKMQKERTQRMNQKKK
ncbi:MAG: membrane protein insertase YidC [Bacteroidota bacterium]